MSSAEVNRIEAIVSKLSHRIAEIRYRSASNLCFKLQSGIAKHTLNHSAHTIQMIFDGLLSSIDCLIVSNMVIDNKLDIEYILALLKSLIIVKGLSDHSTISTSRIIKMTESLQMLSLRKDIDVEVKSLLSKVKSVWYEKYAKVAFISNRLLRYLEP